MNNQIVGIVDEPNPRGNEDTLDIYRHASALTEFIKKTTTPMTIGIQGEWGSGKTSLLNSIYYSLEQEGIYKQIWINSWEHSLLTTPEESLLKIINEIIHEMLSSDDKMDRQENIKKIASNVFRGALRVGATVIGGSKAGDVTEELLGANVNSIKELREQLVLLANEIKNRPTNPHEKIIIYVDDLDRIEPKDAVQVLELLKNIFSIPNCVFVLAIDYQVVVKGLEHKFGKRTEENEWEFRAFFDKIIQLPFMMPMGQYNIGKYVSDLLKQIGFIDSDDQFDQEIQKIISHTIGGNPRSLKRLVNSLALIDIFSKIESDIVEKESSEENDMDDIKDILLFSLVCLQISYPSIYELLIKNPDFPNWDKDTAFEVTKLSEEKDKDKFDRDFGIVKNTEDFDEEWEAALYRICYPKPRYRTRVADISRFFSYIKDELLKDHKDGIKDIIAEVIDDTAVTSVSTTDDSQVKMPKREKGTFKRVQYDELDTTLLSLKEKGQIEEQQNDTISIFNKIRDSLPDDIDIRYWEWGVSMYVAKHKFVKYWSPTKKGKHHGFMIMKDYRTKYKYPKIEGVLTNHVRPYKGLDKPSTAAFCEQFYFGILDSDHFINNEEKILNLINTSYDIAKNHWDKRLRIDAKRGNVNSEIKEINSDLDETDKFAKKVLTEDYNYNF
jgi:hypothetical protein